MPSENRSKINQLLAEWPHGTVATSTWLSHQGVYQQLAHEYEKTGWLKRLGQGAFSKAHEKVEWAGGLYAVQKQLKLPIHLGAKSALEMRGFGHFVALGKGAPLYLFATTPTRLPKWFLKYPWDRAIHYKMPQLFRAPYTLGLTSHSIGTFEIQITAPERAIMEALHLVPDEQSFEEAKLLMESLVTLRPKLVQKLLEQCTSLKVKRLFMFLAENCNHAWVKKLNLSHIDFGTGKRVIAKGGRYDAKFKITVPKNLFEDQDNGEQT